MGKRGKKDCPNCQSEVGARTRECSCGHVFKKKDPAQVVSKIKETVVKTVDRVAAILQKEERSGVYVPVMLSMNPQEHADRILGYGQVRAKFLYDYHLWNGGWSHVDWSRVAQGL